MPENLILKQKTKIDTSWIDASARLKPSGLVNLLVQAAIESADQLGFGFKDLEEQQLAWVLSRLSIEIYEPLHWYDEAEVETWPKSIEGILYMRDFIVKNQHGKVVACATSAWLAIDIQSRRPKKMNVLSDSSFSFALQRIVTTAKESRQYHWCPGNFLNSTSFWGLAILRTT
jgi:medium-chain acyl-[acyl-carrier-protein] hydrolase